MTMPSSTKPPSTKFKVYIEGLGEMEFDKVLPEGTTADTVLQAWVDKHRKSGRCSFTFTRDQILAGITANFLLIDPQAEFIMEVRRGKTLSISFVRIRKG